MLRFATGIVAAALALATAGTAAAAGQPDLLPACAYGGAVPGLSGYEQARGQQDAWAYADSLPGVSTGQRTADAQTFAAAAAAYVYGLSLVDVHETVKRFEVRNLITSIDALSTPANETTVSPNVDTAYTVGWIDLTSGPVVISVPNTGGRFSPTSDRDRRAPGPETLHWSRPAGAALCRPASRRSRAPPTPSGC
jgi:hypothetical protein